jgi:hypothetical protein
MFAVARRAIARGQQSARTGPTLNTYITKYKPLESLGLACKYLLVVATDAWPKV